MVYIEVKVPWKGSASAFGGGAPAPDPKIYTSFSTKNHERVFHAVFFPTPQGTFSHYDFYRKGTRLWGSREEKLKRVMLKDPE